MRVWKEAWKKNQRIRIRENVDLCKASTKQTGLSANTEVLQSKEVKNTEEKPKGGGGYILFVFVCVFSLSASCDTLSAAL